jgi:hypothetical protein
VLFLLEDRTTETINHNNLVRPEITEIITIITVATVIFPDPASAIKKGV